MYTRFQRVDKRVVIAHFKIPSHYTSRRNGGNTRNFSWDSQFATKMKSRNILNMSEKLLLR